MITGFICGVAIAFVYVGWELGSLNGKIKSMEEQISELRRLKMTNDKAPSATVDGGIDGR